ncbi:hypothetical protein J6590_068597 [Homalodisca vitripennis]|nr:hypothetical protein J6590_068597 [Homalodisca vitripennis]
MTREGANKQTLPHTLLPYDGPGHRIIVTLNWDSAGPKVCTAPFLAVERTSTHLRLCGVVLEGRAWPRSIRPSPVKKQSHFLRFDELSKAWHMSDTSRTDDSAPSLSAYPPAFRESSLINTATRPARLFNSEQMRVGHTSRCHQVQGDDIETKRCRPWREPWTISQNDNENEMERRGPVIRGPSINEVGGRKVGRGDCGRAWPIVHLEHLGMSVPALYGLWTD